MAIAKTGAMFKTLTFDGQSSRNYGVYITGEAVYNAPDRAVEMITIPGRNGAFARDDGRFENIEVTYPAGVFAENETDFAKAISDFRNMLCSRKGYCRLTDDYNPDEYREAVYKSGLEVTPALLRAGEFEITFECKPQRFLTSGETAVSVANNGTITNPTLFDAKPMLEVKGYGDINLGSDLINVDNSLIGIITLPESHRQNGSFYDYQQIIDVSALNASDTITMSNVSFNLAIGSSYGQVYTRTIVSTTNIASYTYDGFYSFDFILPTITFNKGTAGTFTASAVYTFYYPVSTLNTHTFSYTLTYDGASTIDYSFSNSPALNPDVKTIPDTYWNNMNITGNSTKYAAGDPMYIDLDIGEAWNEDYGYPVSVNNAVTLPAKLPVLPPGSTTITYDNTITSFKIVPRWWQV